MGLSSMPIPSEGVLTLVLANTALTISILKEIFRSVLHLFSFSPEAPDGAPEHQAMSSEDSSLTDRFRNMVKPVRFGTGICRRRAAEWHSDCRVCLVQFDSSSVVNRLHCGHLFHKSCLERWLDYKNETCPLCRSHLLPDVTLANDSSSSSAPVFQVW